MSAELERMLGPWSDFAWSLTTRQRAALMGVLGAGLAARPDDAAAALLEPFAAALGEVQEQAVADWSVLVDYGPLSRDALLQRLVELEHHMTHFQGDHSTATSGLVIALLRYLAPDQELYARALATALVVVDGAAFTLEDHHAA